MACCIQVEGRTAGDALPLEEHHLRAAPAAAQALAVPALSPTSQAPPAGNRAAITVDQGHAGHTLAAVGALTV